MTHDLPEKLANSPLIEALFEIRFVPSTENAGERLPFMLYAALRDDYPDVGTLPVAKLPREIREQDPALRYQPAQVLRGKTDSIQVGGRVVSLSTLDYPGWTRFKGIISRLIQATKSTSLIKEVERFSFRYINLIESLPSKDQVPLLNAHIDFSGAPVMERGLQVRFERDQAGFTTVVQVIPRSTATIASQRSVSGLLIDVDTLRQSPGTGLIEGDTSILDEGHSILKQNFFSLLTKSTIKRLGGEP